MKLPHQHGEEEKAQNISECIKQDEGFSLAADVFKQLGDSSRLKIFSLLCRCEECVINIAYLVNMTPPAVSHHLKQLKSGGLIVSRRSGKEVFYKASNSKQSRLLQQTIEQIIELLLPKINNP